MNVRELFEKEYAESHNLPPETFEQYRMGESYRLPLIAKCWRFYSAGFYASVAAMQFAAPEKTKCKDYGHGGFACGADDCWLRDV